MVDILYSRSTYMSNFENESPTTQLEVPTEYLSYT